MIFIIVCISCYNKKCFCLTCLIAYSCVTYCKERKLVPEVICVKMCLNRGYMKPHKRVCNTVERQCYFVQRFLCPKCIKFIQNESH